MIDRMTAKQKLVAPKSIAVLGASMKPGIGRSIVENILNMNYTGTVYAVNVRAESVHEAVGYRTVLEIPEDIDLAIIAVPSRFVLEVVEQCGQKGVAALVCIAAGFKEVGDMESEQRLLDIIHKYGMCMIGPNCMGILNTAPGVRMNATINPKPPVVGNIAMLTQSGALGAAYMDFANTLGIGFSMIVSTGNQADMNVCDFLDLVEEDPNTKVVFLYLEGIQEPLRFRELVKKMTKPVIVLKSGRTSAGAKAAGSHTGSLAGNDAVADAILRQAGCIRAKSLEDAFLLTMTMSKMDVPKGNRIGIVSNTGGIGILMSDALTERGFELTPLPEEVVKELTPKLLPESSVRNPIDLVAPAIPEHYRYAVESMINCGQYDALVITCVPPATTDTGKVAEEIAGVIKKSPIPVMTCFYGPECSGPGKRVLNENGLLSYDFPEKMAEYLEYIRPRKTYPRTEPEITFDPEQVRKIKQCFAEAKKSDFLPMQDTEALLRAAGIRTAGSAYLKTAADIESLELEYPLVAKIDHPEIIHKSDVGGVRLNIPSKEELQKVFEEFTLKFAGLRGVFVQEQIKGDTEIIVGAIYDPVLGHAVLTGMGGTLVEYYQDTAFGHVPVSAEDAARMVDSLKCSKLLKGYRGRQPADIGQLENIVVRISRMLEEFPEIAELDINPLLYDPDRKSFLAVDFRAKLRG